MPVIRVSDETYTRLKSHATPFEDTPDRVIARALSALDLATGKSPRPFSPTREKATEGPKLPQKEFRIPLLVTLLDLAGAAPAKAVRERMKELMTRRLSKADHASSSSGAPHWWNAVCWLRIDLIKEGLMKGNSPRGIWEISKQGKAFPSSLHRRTNGNDRTVARGSLQDMVRKYQKMQPSIQNECFLKVGQTVFQW
jgi:hypothetical protein